MKKAPTIQRVPARRPAEDFQLLYQDGIGSLEQMASGLWTDYNSHDPGITILEALCYAMTELGYRSGWHVKDLMAPKPGTAAPRQPFFTAREILTVNPVTPEDFRRLLVGLEAVRNAWVACKTCGCDVAYYDWCDKGEPGRGFGKPPAGATGIQRVGMLGMYEVLLELEEDPESGDLNDRKVEVTRNVPGEGGKDIALVMELRFPDMSLGLPIEWRAWLGLAAVTGVTLRAFAATRGDDIFTDLPDDDARDKYVRAHWNYAFYASLEITLDGGVVIATGPAALHLFGGNGARAATSAARLREFLEDAGPNGFVQACRHKARKTAAAMDGARALLAAHRNLAEEYCRVGAVGIEDVSVCADIEVAPGADIELVQAQAWLRIERYFNPPIPHYALQELLDAGMPVEDIFEGPQGGGSFVTSFDLEQAALVTVLRTSDLVNLLMGIDGVVAVNNLLLSKYDEEGNPVAGSADPDDKNKFDAARTSAAWQLYLSPSHLPRLYYRRSRFLFLKNGLPFVPRMDEARDTLVQLRGEAERPRIADGADDLPVPGGTWRDPAAYYPFQYELPRTFGIGHEGLRGDATPARVAQARQLQAYLMVFEQLLANGFAQLAHGADLFALDTAVRTYFPGRLGPDVLQAYGDLVSGLDDAKLAAMLETPREFAQRRNRFLDHLLARFSEDFGDYALLLTRLNGERVGLDRLAADKAAFLKAYPEVSRDRARSFDHTHCPCAPGNVPRIKRRVGLLLGYPDLQFSWVLAAPDSIGGYALSEVGGPALLSGAFPAPVTGVDMDDAIRRASAALLSRMSLPQAWRVVADGPGYRAVFEDEHGERLGQTAQLYDSREQATAQFGELLAWGANERVIVVEHLLLRPKFPGDALIGPCASACDPCDSDPYSFRLSFVLPGWSEPFAGNLDLRAFAERTIRYELPAHLVAKVCWVGNDGYVEDPCDPVLQELATLLQEEGKTGGGERPDAAHACSCAVAIRTAFAAVFEPWLRAHAFDYIAPAALAQAMHDLFAIAPAAGSIDCAAVLDEALFAKVRTLMQEHFKEVALRGWQFERFAGAWCAWLEEDAKFDWGSERLHDRVQALLHAGLGNSPPSTDALCALAAGLVGDIAGQFDTWIEKQIEEGRRPDEFGVFDPVPAKPDGTGVPPAVLARINALLTERYGTYAAVSYWLRVVLRLLAGLRNTWPPATLHDCDEGSDANPVRLGQTALGSQAAGASSPRT